MKQKTKMGITDIKILRMDFIRIIVSALLILLISPFANSQTEPQNHNEEVTIVGTYNPSINEAYKINIKPKTNELNFQIPEFSFNSLDIKQKTTIGVNPIKAISLRSGSRTKKFDNYLKAGIGSRLSPYIDFYHSSGEKGKYNFNANIYSYSSFTNVQDYSPSPFSQTHAKLYYTKFISEHILDVGFKYGINTNRYYGYIPEDWSPLISIPDADLKQTFNIIQANVDIKSAYKKKSKLHHKINIGAYYYFDKHQTTELNANLYFDLYRSFDVVDMLDYQNFGIEGNFDFYANNDSLTKNDEFYINLKPYFTAKYGEFSFNAGLSFGYLGDSASSFHFWPVIDLDMNIVPGLFSIFAGINGKLEKQSYLVLTTENPYLSPTSTLGWLNEKVNVYGGFRANIAQLVGLNFKIGWKTFDNMAFFINHGDYSIPQLSIMGPLNKFNTIFDNGSLFYIDAEISFNMGKDLKLWLGGAFNKYELDSLTYAYHKPLTVVRFGGSYLILNKVKLSAELLYNGIRYASDPSNMVQKDIELEAYLDLNFSVEYKINNKLSVFLNGTNLLNNNYEQFYSYPVQGLQIMGGIMYRF